MPVTERPGAGENRCYQSVKHKSRISAAPKGGPVLTDVYNKQVENNEEWMPVLCSTATYSNSNSA